jgi:hypothetical protein
MGARTPRHGANDDSLTLKRAMRKRSQGGRKS